jgi:hypothetical protein
MPSLSTGLINNSQVLVGARTLAASSPYIPGAVLQAPRVVLHDPITLAAAMASATAWNASTTTSATPNIISFVGGSIEFGGMVFPLDTGPATGSNKVGNVSIDLDYLYSQLCIKNTVCPEYIIAAVPRYDEAMTEQEARARGLSFYLSLASTGEFVARRVINEACMGTYCGAGGIEGLYMKYINGCADCDEISVLFDCLNDTCSKGMCIKGVAFILAESCPASNCCSSSANYTKCELEQILATLPSVQSVRLFPRVGAFGTDIGVTTAGMYTLNEFFGTVATPTPFPDDTTGTAGSNSSFLGSPSIGSDFGEENGPGSQLYRLQSISFFKDEAAVNSCDSPVVIQSPSSMAQVNATIDRLTFVDPNTNPCVVNCGYGWDANEIRIVAREYDLSCCNFDPTNQGHYPKISRYITKRDAIGAPWLGRVNPAYSEDSQISLRLPNVSSGGGALHYYANPIGIMKFSIRSLTAPVAPNTAVTDPNPNVIIDPASVVLMPTFFLGNG